MANTRVFQCHDLVSNGVDVDGTSLIGFSPQYAHVNQSTPDGAVGVEDVDRAALRVPVRLVTTDVTKIAALLDAAVGDTIFYGKESGLATETKVTLGTTGIVWTGFNFTSSFNADAQATFDGLLRFTASTTTLNEALKTESAEVASPGTYPARLWRPNMLTFDPDAGGANIVLGHATAMSMSMAAKVEEDSLEDDIGHTAVDLNGWGPLNVSMSGRDLAEAVATDYDKAVELMLEAIGILTTGFKGRGGAADQTLTIQGLKWSAADVNHQTSYSEIVARGFCQWYNVDADPAAKTYSLTGTDKLFAFA